MDKKKLDSLNAFLQKETPTYGGCMVCKAKREDDRTDLLLIERRKFANGDGFTINMRLFYEYDFLWDENNPWKILWKYDGSE